MALREDGARQYDGVTTGKRSGRRVETGRCGEGEEAYLTELPRPGQAIALTASRASYHSRLSFVNLPRATIQARTLPAAATLMLEMLVNTAVLMAGFFQSVIIHAIH